MDDDRQSDLSWNSDMREVELWESERFGDKFFGYQFLIHRVILLFILHPRLVRAPSIPAFTSVMLVLFHSLSRHPLLHRQLLLKKRE